MTSAMFKLYAIGNTIPLRNRICMQSMTRNRCFDNNLPGDAVVDHYATRARDGVGLIITEGTIIWLNGAPWPHTPVMFSEEHARAWEKVTHAVHKEGGKILLQTWHLGRSQNENMPMLKNSGYPVLAPSRIPATGGKYRDLPGVADHTLNIKEIEQPQEIIEQYRNSVVLAKQAGFDGIEILAQGGYLLHNFLASCSNKRTDKYGGSTENRCRFVLEVVDTVIDVWGPGAVGIKLCPTDNLSDIAVPYKELSETYSYLISQLVSRGLGFINLTRRGCDIRTVHDKHFQVPISRPPGTELPINYDPLHEFGPLVKFPGSKTALMVNHEYTVEEAEELLRDDKIDLIGFGRHFIYNPDLVTRAKDHVPFAINDRGGYVYYGPYKHPSENYNDWACA